MLDKSAQAGRAPLRERRNDCYDSPPQAVEALLRTITLPHKIWEPCCGTGNIVGVLRNFGHEVYATDLNDRGCPDSVARVDFLMPDMTAPTDCEAIVTNPPYALAEEFVRRALQLCPQVIMLLRLAFLESERRSIILDSGWLEKVLVFRNRLPMMHRAGWDGPKSSSSMAFAWFCWNRTHIGPAELHRISW